MYIDYFQDVYSVRVYSSTQVWVRDLLWICLVLSWRRQPLRLELNDDNPHWVWSMIIRKLKEERLQTTKSLDAHKKGKHCNSSFTKAVLLRPSWMFLVTFDVVPCEMFTFNTFNFSIPSLHCHLFRNSGTCPNVPISFQISPVSEENEPLAMMISTAR